MWGTNHPLHHNCRDRCHEVEQINSLERDLPINDELYSLGSTQYNEKNYDAAMKYFKQSTHHRAHFMIGYMYFHGYGVEQDYYDAFVWFWRAADKNDELAQHWLGVQYQYGLGVPKDRRIAREFYEKARCNTLTIDIVEEISSWFDNLVNGSYEFVQTCIGGMYNIGTNLTEDNYEALECYRKAQQNKFAQLNLGNYYWRCKDYHKVFQLYHKSALQGLRHAQYKLGDMYYTGCYVEKDYGEALKWYTKAVEQDCKYAQNSLGMMYCYGQGVEKNYTKAITLYWKSAKQGNLPAQHNLGTMHYDGFGVERDYHKALEWFRRAAQQGYAPSQWKIGNIYYDGKGVETNYDEAVKWYTVAVQQNCSEAQNSLANMYYNGRGVEKNCDKAIELYKKAAEQDNEVAQSNLALVYFSRIGVDRDYARAAYELYQKLATKNNARGQNGLGILYFNGYYVEQDHRKAFEWFSKAAEQCCADSQFNLGLLYYDGKGVEKNYNKAFDMYRASADQNNIQAQNNLGLMYKNGEGVERDYHKAFELFQKSAARDNCCAQWNLATMYRDGLGVERIRRLEIYWYIKAARTGSDTAIRALLSNSIPKNYDIMLISKPASDDQCIVCCENQREIQCLPCEHVYMCADCSWYFDSGTHCAVCRKYINMLLVMQQ